MALNQATGQDHITRSPRGLEFDNYRERLLKALRSPNSVPKEVREEFSKMNENLKLMADRKRGKLAPDMVGKALAVGDVQTTPVLQEFSEKYENDEFIGTRLMPEVMVDTGTGAATYWKHDPENDLTAPDDTIGTDGTVNEVTEGLSQASATMYPHSLQERIDARTQAAMDAPVRLLVNPLMTVMNGLKLRQELRISTVCCTSSNYGSNTAAIAAADRWNAGGGGDPAGAVDTAKDTLFGTGRTVGFTGVATFNVLRRHPAALDMFKYTRSNILSVRDVADWLGLDELLVGKARYNTSMRGATASYSRAWTETVFGVLKVPEVPMVKQACFGITLQEPWVEQEFFVADSGGWGQFVTKVAHADSHKVVSTLCGYLYTTVINT